MFDALREPAFVAGLFLFAHLLSETGASVQVHVRDNNVDQALKALKKENATRRHLPRNEVAQLLREALRETRREKAEAVRRARKLARKKAQREGISAPGRSAMR